MFFVHFVNVVHVSPPHPSPQQKPSPQYVEHRINTFFAPMQYIVSPHTIYRVALDNILYIDLRSKLLSLIKIKFYLLFRSLNRTLTYRSKVLSLGSKNKTYFILYFSCLFVTLSLSHADCALYGRGWVGDKTYIKAFTTLWF